MKLQIASKDKERYAKENPRINVIKEKLASSDLTGTVQKLNSFLKETQFKTKFDVPEKDLSKYISLQILEGSNISEQVLNQFINMLWENEDSFFREIGTFVLGDLYSKNPGKYFEKVVTMAKLCTSWEHVDNLVSYTIEEFVAKDFDTYRKKLDPLVTHENQWVRRLAIVSLGRAIFLTKDKDQAKECLESIEKSFTDDRKIVLDANSFIMGTIGFRIAPEEIVKYFEKYRSSTNLTIIKLFCDIVRRSKIVRELPKELFMKIMASLEQWKKIPDTKIETSVDSALKFIQQK